MMTTFAVPPPVVEANPFVGPRSLHAGEPIHGRDREIRHLSDLLIAERIVLLYSPSGAGKTSLIEAGLVPRLAERRFQISPVIRVSLRPPEQASGANRYLVSTLQSLEAGLHPHAQRSAADLLALGLEGYLREWAGQDDFGAGNELLIFDQFEEVLVLDPGDDADKRAFFAEVGTALEERGRWALFSMREDYIAGLDPYLGELPTRLHTRMRLDLLSPESARRAAEKSATAGGRPFQEAAAAKLVENLRRVQAQRDGRLVYVAGPVVEPLQLQVVCRKLWESLAPDAAEIGEEDVDRLGRVADALADYYATAVGDVAQGSGVPERIIRDWLGEVLITEQGVRRQQQHGPGTDPAAAQHAVRLLEDAHLVRSEARRGTRWLELAHDQLIEPIRDDNAEWRRAHLNPLQLLAQQWLALNRPRDLLLTGRSLADAQQWAAANQAVLTENERDFLTASGGAEGDRRRRRRNTILLRWFAAVLALALVAAVIQWRIAEDAREQATSRARAAEALTQLAVDPAQAVITAREALASAPTREAEDALRQAMAQNPPRAVLTHDDDVNSSVFSPDGSLLLTASRDGTARIWDSRTGAQQSLLEHDGNVIDARFSPDGRTVVTLTEDQRLSIWRTDALTEPPLTADGLWLPLAFTPDGTRIVASAFAFPAGDPTAVGGVRVLDVRDGRQVLPPVASVTGSVSVIVVSPDGRLFLTAGEDLTARVWDTATGAPVGPPLGGHVGAVGAAFRHDTGAVATGDGEGTVRVWQWPEPRDPLLIDSQQHGFAAPAFGPDGELLVFGDKSPRLFGADGQVLRTFEGHLSWINQATFSSDGGRLLTASMDGTARVWDLPSGREVAVFRGHEDGVLTADMDPTGRAVATSSGTHVRVFDVPDQQFLRGYSDWALDAEFFPDGRRVAAAGQDGNVLVWDDTGRTVATLPGDGPSVRDIDVDPTGTYVSVVQADGNVSVWDVEEEALESRTLVGGAAEAAFDRSGARLVIADTWAVQLWDWDAQATPEPSFVNDYLSRSLMGYRAAFSPVDGTVVTARGRLLELWDDPGSVASDSVARPRATLDGHTGTVVSVAFSGDGRLLVTASLDGTARIWRTSDGRLEQVLRGHRGVLWAAAFDDRGRHVVTGGEDGSIGVWDASDGRNLAMLPRHTDTVNSVEFAPGTELRIVSASDDTTVRTYTCETCGPIDELQERAARISGD